MLLILFSAQPLMMFYICTKLKGFLSYFVDTISRLNFTKGHNSIKNVGGVMFFLFSAHCLMMIYICTTFHINIQKVPELLSRHNFQKENFKGA